MTESLPRSPVGPGPATMPAMSWYEFVLNDKLLEEHLLKENPGNCAQIGNRLIQASHFGPESFLARFAFPLVVLAPSLGAVGRGIRGSCGVGYGEEG